MYSYNRPKVHHLRTVAGVQTFPVLSSFQTSKILFLYLIKRHVLHKQSLPSISSFDSFGNSTHQHEIPLSHEKISPHSTHFLFISYLIIYSILYWGYLAIYLPLILYHILNISNYLQLRWH